MRTQGHFIDRLKWAGLVLLLGIGIQPAVAGEKKPPLHHVTAQSCGECHQEIYQQWSKSMHAASSAVKDPIHGALYRAFVGDPTQEGVRDAASGKYPVCLQCHAPNAARDEQTKLDALPAYSEGVNCVACHTMSAFKGVQGEDGALRPGAKAYEYATDSLQGPHGAYAGAEPVVSPGSGSAEKAVNPYPHQARSALFKGSEACLGCHDHLKNANGVPVCATGPEVVASGGKVTCQSCHMPVVNGSVSHAMSGGHDPAMLKRGVVLTVKGEKRQAVVTLQNLLPHNYPTGAPFRYVVLKVTALNAKGEPVWTNFEQNVLKEDPQAMLMMKLVDKEGKPAPSVMAVSIAGDTRLLPGESRQLTYAIPVAEAVSVRAELRYGLMLPLMIEKMGDKMPEEAKQKTLIARAESSL